MAILRVNVRPGLRWPMRSQRSETMSERAQHSNNADRTRNHDESIHNHNLQPKQTHTYEEQTLSNQLAPIWHRIVWTLTPSTTVGRAIVSAKQRLQESGSETPQLDAQVILAHVLGVDRSWLFAHYDYKLNEDETERYTELIARRGDYEPVAYLIGRKEFYGFELNVDDRVLIPRPETELLVDVVLRHIEMSLENNENVPIKIADVGTGSGAIAISVAANSPNTQVYAIDLSADALKVASDNIEKLGQSERVSCCQGDLLDPLPEPVDIIVANLPYINSNEFKNLAPDIREYEPQLALEAGPDGLDAIRRLLEDAPNRLNPNGTMFLEIGADQGEMVISAAKALIPQAQYIDLRQDYNGRDRLVTITI